MNFEIGQHGKNMRRYLLCPSEEGCHTISRWVACGSASPSATLCELPKVTSRLHTLQRTDSSFPPFLSLSKGRGLVRWLILPLTNSSLCANSLAAHRIHLAALLL